MNVLAIEAGGAQFGVSCVRADDSAENAFETRAAFASSEARSLSRDLVIQIDSALSRANWTTETLDAIAVGIGPGSWTSLRIALSTAKTLAQVAGCELCGVCSFAAWARAVGAPENGLIFVAAPCRPDAIYGQIFNIEYSNSVANSVANIASIGDEEVDTPQNWATRIAALNHAKLPVGVCGEAREAVLKELLNVQQNTVEKIVAMENVAVATAQLGAIRSSRGEVDNVLTLQPLYIGVSNAERVWNERLAKEKFESA